MSKRRTILLRVSLLVALVWTLHTLEWLRPVEAASRTIISSGAHAAYRGAGALRRRFSSWFGTSSVGLWTPSASSTAAIALSPLEATVLATELALTREENAALRSLLNFSTSSSYSLVGADVIGRSLDPVGTTVIINQGTGQGLGTGNPVVSGSGLLVGTVIRVDEGSALVRLINDSRSRVAAMVSGGTKSQGLVEGGYGLSVKMNFIPQNEVIKPGDSVVTSGLEGSLPRGLYIGTVEAVEKKTQEPFQQAVLKPAADLDSLTVVAVARYRPHE